MINNCRNLLPFSTFKYILWQLQMMTFENNVVKEEIAHNIYKQQGLRCCQVQKNIKVVKEKNEFAKTNAKEISCQIVLPFC